MYMNYVTQNSNQLHQLLVSVSRHFYLLKNGILKYQEKPLNVNINNFHKSGREHLVFYILRDHFSGNFVFNLTTTDSLIPLVDFLYYGWSSRTEEKYLWGLPQSIYIPKLISSEELFDGLYELGVEPLNPPSGFASGVHMVKELENNICFFLLRTLVNHDPKFLNTKKSRIYQRMLKLKKDDSLVEKWQNNLPEGHPLDIPEYDEFLKIFEKPDREKPGLQLVGPVVENIKKSKSIYDLPENIGKYKFSEKKLDKATDIIYEAWETRDREKMMNLAYQALQVTPYCVDAYNLLAGESEDNEEKLNLYLKGVEAGKLSLGDAFIKENTGDFWGLIETRPYMRALLGMADCLWNIGQRKEALAIYQNMLELNPGDNQGIRYLLVNYLLEEKEYGEVKKMLSMYRDESCFMLFPKALLNYCTFGSNLKSNNSLIEAVRINGHVPLYLLGEKFMPYSLPDYYEYGDENEAVIYVDLALNAWRSSPGALDWLKYTIEQYSK